MRMEGRVEVHSVGRNCTHEDLTAVENMGVCKEIKKDQCGEMP